MLIYKCDYCGAESNFDGVGQLCPSCGAAVVIVENRSSPAYKAHKRRHVKTIIKTAIATTAILFTAFIATAIIVSEIDDGVPAGYSYADYSEEGHAPGDPYNGEIAFDFDLTDYNIISWTEDPVITWGTKGRSYSSDRLCINARIHNNGDDDISSLSIRFTLYDKEGSEIDTVGMYGENLLAEQDELVYATIYIKNPMTYADIASIKLTECSITV